jgi:hypothetical protein
LDKANRELITNAFIGRLSIVFREVRDVTYFSALAPGMFDELGKLNKRTREDGGAMDILKLLGPFGKSHLLLLEAFDLEEYERVVFVDAETLVLSSLRESVFEISPRYPFVASSDDWEEPYDTWQEQAKKKPEGGGARFYYPRTRRTVPIAGGNLVQNRSTTSTTSTTESSAEDQDEDRKEQFFSASILSFGGPLLRLKGPTSFKSIFLQLLGQMESVKVWAAGGSGAGEGEVLADFNLRAKSRWMDEVARGYRARVRCALCATVGIARTFLR